MSFGGDKPLSSATGWDLFPMGYKERKQRPWMMCRKFNSQGKNQRTHFSIPCLKACLVGMSLMFGGSVFQS